MSWFPSYEAAKAFTEMRHSSEPFLHLVHPRPVPWHILLTPIAAQLRVPLVPYAEWFVALEKSASDAIASPDEAALMTANPALQLIPFFRVQSKAASQDSGREPMGLMKLATEKSTRMSATLANLPGLDEERARQWVGAWQKAGFL